LRARFNRYQQLSPDEKAELRERLAAFQQLPQEEREARRHKWESLTPEQRRAARERFVRERRDR